MPVDNFDYSITWSDFTSMQTRPSGENEDAQIHPEMSFINFVLKGKGKGVIINEVDINIEVVKPDSWTVVPSQTKELAGA
jgi:hypothetical protein